MISPSSPATGFDGWLRRYATQATTAAALIVGVTGVMMFFHLARGSVEAAHEWLGLMFVALAALHVLRHRRGFVAMMRERRQQVLFVLAAAVMATFLLVPDGSNGGNPRHRLIGLAMDAPLTRLAPVIGLEPEAALRRVTTTGLAAAHSGQSLAGIAAANHVEPERVLALVLDDAARSRPAGDEVSR